MDFVEVILPLSLKGTFTYKVPAALQSKVAPGMRVLVPFRGKKIYTGIVNEIHTRTPEGFVPKEIISILDDQPILPLAQIRFWQWLADYYLCNLGEIYRLAFPSSLKLESETYLKLKANVPIDFENLDGNEMYLIQALEVRQLINLTEIEAFIPKKEIIKTINSLIDLQYIEIDEKVAEKYRAKEIAYVKISNEVKASLDFPKIMLQLKKSPKQQELFLLLLEKHTEFPNTHVRKSAILEEGNFAPAQIKSLLEKGLVTEFYLEKDRLTSYDGALEDLEELSEAQQKAVAEIDGAFSAEKDVLLHGVTSSGKTHIYLDHIEKVLAQSGTVLFLVPEISLAKQMVQRLEKKYGSLLGFYHQKLTDFERVEVWRKVLKNDLRIVIGTRISLFLPFEKLDLLIVDEEHDQAYRPLEVSPYFNAKDAAQVLAQFHAARVILGSATPSVESYYAAEKNILQYVFLGERFGGAALPIYELIDFKERQNAKKTLGSFTLDLIDNIKTTLENRKQTMILHNRRGYANVVECTACSYVNYCSNCDVVMTWHKESNEMKCHYCGQKAARPKLCPKCGSAHLNERGIGVEQIHEEVSRLFPDYMVDRMDVDSMRKKFAYEKLYEKLETGETQILVGTQMISKGLDFSEVDLVAIPRADSMIYIQDFRAEEKAFQLITQIAGRAGRASGKGKILIQTSIPDRPIYELIQRNNLAEIYRHFLSDRQTYHYPPFTRLILLELKHRKEDKVDRASQFMGSILRKYLPAECVLGPAKSPLPKINLLYQYQILLKLPRGKKYPAYKDLVLKSFEEFDEITAYRTIKKLIFVDF